MHTIKNQFDVVILGAGAAGLMCAITAAKRGKSVLVLEKSNKAGKKILMSGGGRCNFTNLYVAAEHFLSNNPHFCKSALKTYTPADFISMVEAHGIEYEEKKHQQLFCINSSKDILYMLLSGPPPIARSSVQSPGCLSRSPEDFYHPHHRVHR